MLLPCIVELKQVVGLATRAGMLSMVTGIAAGLEKVNGKEQKS